MTWDILNPVAASSPLAAQTMAIGGGRKGPTRLKFSLIVSTGTARMATRHSRKASSKEEVTWRELGKGKPGERRRFSLSRFNSSASAGERAQSHTSFPSQIGRAHV